MLKKIKNVFREDSCYKVFLLSLLMTGLGYGLYKGMIDNYLAEIVVMGKMDRGIKVAFIVCCINYILDSVISLASMASNVYVQDISDSPEEVRATISTGVSVNHLITILIALFGGYIWQQLGIETLFCVSAVLGLCNSAYAATIKTSKHTR